MSDLQDIERHSHNPLVRYFRILGPGLVTGASDDDPSGITTYSVAGASLGYGMLWTALATLPLMAAVQLICARIGLVTGRGLAGAVRRHYPRPFLYAACLLLLAANVFNIAADLAGMADAAQMLTAIPALVCVPLFGVAILVVTVYASYATLAGGLKWLTSVLFAYVAAALLAKPDWWGALVASVSPSFRWDSLYVATFVGVLGTTISPYLFFWQASQEVEEEKAREAAEALRPLAGDSAYLLFAVGLIGTGVLAVPVLAGSASFAVAEVFGWRAGLDLSPRRGRQFYLVFAGSIVAGMLLDLGGIPPIRMLFLSAVVNGLLAPPLLLLV